MKGKKNRSRLFPQSSRIFLTAPVVRKGLFFLLCAEWSKKKIKRPLMGTNLTEMAISVVSASNPLLRISQMPICTRVTAGDLPACIPFFVNTETLLRIVSRTHCPRHRPDCTCDYHMYQSYVENKRKYASIIDPEKRCKARVEDGKTRTQAANVSRHVCHGNQKLGDIQKELEHSECDRYVQWKSLSFPLTVLHCGNHACSDGI